ncbi:MAG TPA: substrate-binding domain-containing protein [Planctomycetota bacterium]|nr:substrate-binding domain-containing protein [Planctomycetota bacterium]
MRHAGAAGRINAAWIVFVASLIAFGILVWSLIEPEKKAGAGETLVVFCAPAIKVPAEAVAHEYEKLYKTKIQFQFQPSESLVGSAEISKLGDILLPADDSYNDQARAKNMIAESFPLVRMHAVIVVKKGNPLRIQALKDLSRADVKVALAGDAAAVGKLTRQALEKIGVWEPLEKKAVSKGTVSNVAADVTIGAVDAGIIWNSMLPQYGALEAVEDASVSRAAASVSASILRSSKNPTAALHFARFLAASDKGLMEFKKAGYDVEEGDAWVEHPEIKLFAGAMLKPAIEKTIVDFEEREGARVTRIYDGCGILVSQMRALKGKSLPDAYFACDKSFMTQVADLFLDSNDVSQNQLVILVPKGNPHGITQLKDLGKPGLRVGVGHEKQCALGALTATTFKTSGVFEGVMKNVTVQSATGDMLVNQLLTGSLDAVVAYISNATSSADKLDAIKIDIPCALAVQPIAQSKDSANKRITARLIEAIKSAESRERFEANGFTWKGKQ